MNPSVQSLLSFLPGNSFVMGRGVSRQEPPVESGSSCVLCGESTHQAFWCWGSGSDVVFLVESDAFPGSKEEQLLSKICEAMKLNPGDVAVLARSPLGRDAGSTLCSSFQWRELKVRAPKVLIALGDSMGKSMAGSLPAESALRGQIHVRHDLNLLVTEDLSGMLANPNLKKQAWEDLKLALKLIRF